MLGTLLFHLAAITLNKILLSVALFAVTFVISLLAVGYILVKLPPTFFLDHHCRDWWRDKSPWLRWLGIGAKNLLGIALVVLGAIQSFPGVPGQGILTILIGVVLLDIPGKRRLERKLIGRPKVLRAVNRLRARYKKPPLVVTQTPPEDLPGNPNKTSADPLKGSQKS